MFEAPDELPCRGEETHLTQKHTEGLFVEGKPGIPQIGCNQGGAGRDI